MGQDSGRPAPPGSLRDGSGQVLCNFSAILASQKGVFNPSPFLQTSDTAIKNERIYFLKIAVFFVSKYIFNATGKFELCGKIYTAYKRIHVIMKRLQFSWYLSIDTK